MLQLEVEATALSKEKDPSSKARLQKVQEEISRLKEELVPLKLKYENEKGRLDKIRSLKTKLEELKIKAQDAERRYDVAKAADLKVNDLKKFFLFL